MDEDLKLTQIQFRISIEEKKEAEEKAKRNGFADVAKFIRYLLKKAK